MSVEDYSAIDSGLEPSKDDEPGIKYGLKAIKEIEGKAGGPPVVISKSSGSQTTGKVRDFPEHALVVRDRINSKEELQSVDLEIQSSVIQDAIRTIFGHHSRIVVLADPIVFRKPYYPLFHHRKKIQDFVLENSADPTQKRHLGYLIKFMDDNLKGLTQIYESLVQKDLIEFKQIQVIFAAGSTIIGQKKDIQEAFLLHDISDEKEDKQNGVKYVEIRAFQWRYNGSRFGPALETLRLDEFQGCQNITELDYFPLERLKPDAKREALVAKLISRGRKWCQVVNSKHFDYKGVGEVPKKEQNYPWKVGLITAHLSGRTVLDHAAFTETYPDFNPTLYIASRARNMGNDEISNLYDNKSSRKVKGGDVPSQVLGSDDEFWTTILNTDDYTPTDQQALFCPAMALGYSLTEKDWGKFDVDKLISINWKDNATDELQIDLTQKMILVDLVKQYRFPGIQAGNMVRVKGEGLIILLYGPPGCGKTLTAELIAEQEKRPLLRISSGDLGQYSWDADNKLQALLKLALKSDAIVLIDEAEVFLAKRTSDSADSYRRNSLVSVFLNQLEYFQGVMFLTTNRDTDIDEAIDSRIHIRLQYDALGTNDRARIWETQLKKDKFPLDWNRQVFTDLGREYEINGREIQNLAHIAKRLSLQRKEPLTLETIKAIYAMRQKLTAVV